MAWQPTGARQMTSPVNPSRLRTVAQRSRSMAPRCARSAPARARARAAAAFTGRGSTMRSEKAAPSSTKAAMVSAAARGEVRSATRMATAPSREVLPTFDAMANPPTFPLSAKRVVVAMSALLAAWPVVAVAWSAVSSAAKSGRFESGSGTAAITANRAAVAAAQPRYQVRRYAPRSRTGIQNSFSACARLAPAATAAMAAMPWPRRSIQYGAASDR